MSGGGVNTELSVILTALTNKKITLGKNIFNGISKVHPSHSFSYTVTTAATCTTTGSKTGTCICGNTDTQTIAATGHSYGSWVVSSNEATRTRTCSKCGNKETVSNKVELKDADSATKSKYNFKGTGYPSSLVEKSYGGSYSGSGYTGGGCDFYYCFSDITPSSCPVGSIVYIIGRDIITNNSSINKYSIDGSNTIPTGYYKIKAICNRSNVLANGTISYTDGACNLIPFAMGSGYGYGGSGGSGGDESDSSDIKAELSKYIEYLGTSYKVVPA